MLMNVVDSKWVVKNVFGLSSVAKEDFVHRNIDAHSEFHITIKEIGKFWDVLWLVIVSNKPAKKRMDEFREALDRLILYYDM